jgi:hypothetical protein
MPGEIGTYGLIEHYYSTEYISNIMRESIIKSSKKIARSLINSKDINHKLKDVINIIAALGWGIPFFNRSHNEINLYMFNIPVSRYGFRYQLWVINGFLDYILKNQFKIKEIKQNLSISNEIHVKYTQN